MPADAGARLIICDEYLRNLAVSYQARAFEPRDVGAKPKRRRSRGLKTLAAEIIGVAKRGNAPLSLVSSELKRLEFQLCKMLDQRPLLRCSDELWAVFESLGRQCRWRE